MINQKDDVSAAFLRNSNRRTLKFALFMADVGLGIALILSPMNSVLC